MVIGRARIVCMQSSILNQFSEVLASCRTSSACYNEDLQAWSLTLPSSLISHSTKPKAGSHLVCSIENDGKLHN